MDPITTAIVAALPALAAGLVCHLSRMPTQD